MAWWHVDVVIYIYGLYTDAISSSDNTVSNNMTISEHWIEKDVEGKGHGLIWGAVLAFVWRVRTFHAKPSILVPASDHCYFVASCWRTPLRHPSKVAIDQ
jgi:hypothetical protein